jgi:hypothetical protein
MQSVDLINAILMLDEALDSVSGVGPEMVKSYTLDLTSSWPECRAFISHHWLDDPGKEVENIQQQFRRALRAHRQDLLVIQNHFRQLQEFFPRYYSIITRGSFWDYVLGFAAGYFGGGFGVIGAQVWEDWRGKSDSDFAESFGNAVYQFSRAALEFTEKTEQEVESVLSGLLKDLHDFTQGIIATLEAVAETMNISKIYHNLHDPDSSQQIDDDFKQFFEIVLSNRRNQKISARSEANIREMLGIR